MGNESSKKAKEVKQAIQRGSSRQVPSTPAPKPAAKPAPNPAAKPAPKPAAQSSSRPAPAPAASSAAIATCTTPMDKNTMNEMMSAVAAAVPGTSAYRIVGGVAAAMFGSPRSTKDLDMIVPNSGTMSSVVAKLEATGRFGVQKRSSGVPQIWFKASNGKNYNVDVFPPSQLHSSLQFPNSLKADAPGGSAVIGCAQLLNLKILAYMFRKKDNDAADILYLVRFMAANKMRTSTKEVTYADEDFLTSFAETKFASSKPCWVAIGLLRG